MPFDPFLTSVLRQDPSAATQAVSAIKVRELLTARGSQIHREVLHIAGIPSRFLKATDAITNNSIYPLDGGTLPSQAGVTLGQVKLHVDANPTPGMVVVQMDGTGIGEWAYIISVGASNLCTLSQPWTNAPLADGDCALLMPCWLAQYVYVKGEFNWVGGLDQTGTVALHFFDAALTMDGETEIRPTIFMDRLRTVIARSSNYRQSAAGVTHYHMETLRVDAMGGVGFKIQVVAAPAGGGKLWAAYT